MISVNISNKTDQLFETQQLWQLLKKEGRSTILEGRWYYIGHPITESCLLSTWIPNNNAIYFD